MYIIINKKSDELRHAEEELNNEIAHILHSVKIKDLIIDFSCVNLIDSMGVEAIENVSKIYPLYNYLYIFLIVY